MDKDLERGLAERRAQPDDKESKIVYHVVSLLIALEDAPQEWVDCVAEIFSTVANFGGDLAVWREVVKDWE